MTNRIKEVREEKGISRKELAERSGVRYSRVSDYENGYFKTENITVGNLSRIAKALEVTIEDLIKE